MTTKKKGIAVHIDAETMKKIDEYREWHRKNHPEMPLPTKGQVVRNSVHCWFNASLGAWL
ncbi:hypothetical protein ACS769_07610 [Yersinia enterocolitica]|uniref:hypothetical protein n=1 Tax=Yersinia TaxID=629 RepID=UPI0011AA4FFD|nr:MULTISPECIES: hypothetical protein [Yersinia]ELI8278899.1 hypothetical protein [Yersinia enterocolitica]MBW5814421.1 hypothetical protein [Yersinia kristensenii]MBW5831676.1 hypothetical protein [Yersinia kristensenii]HEN3433418.1 hypothetical protein [Yersinia enterocolitica]HEN3495904.1 hypothetical protein [Yersinia enterocolitica]